MLMLQKINQEHADKRKKVMFVHFNGMLNFGDFRNLFRENATSNVDV